MWVVPSRSRPWNVWRLIEAGVHEPVWLRLDSDDPELEGYLALTLPENWARVIGPREGLAELYNAAFRTFPDRDWYGVLADDVVPESEGWERALINVAGSYGLAFGDDGINGPTHATHFVLGGDLVREIGWLALPGLSRIYIDTCWSKIAKRRGVFRYLPEVRLTHRHFSNGLAFYDHTYRKPDKARDRAIYEAWLSTQELP